MERIEGLEKGDYIKVRWLDIYEDVTGNPDKPEVSKRASIGQFWAYQTIDGFDFLVTTTTEDASPEDSGYCCYPIGIVVSIDIIKRRKKRARTRRKVPNHHTTGDNRGEA
jgi:hypothetical protein